jgi:hypothetical protein
MSWGGFRDQVTVELWDVEYVDGGFGKHGRGPFSTERRAAASLRATGWEGRVVRVHVAMSRAEYLRYWPTTALVPGDPPLQGWRRA